MNKQNKKRFLAYLSQFITENKKTKIDKIIRNRMHHVTVVLEDVYQKHNASAVLRSAECFGVQDVHIIEQRNQFKPEQGVAMGSSKWLSVLSHSDTKNCCEQLKKDGYRIVATSPHEKSCSLYDLPLGGKFALLFGTEEQGLTPQALQLADEFVTIPMYGFTESFNVSVSVALCLQHVVKSLHDSDIKWRLDDEELLDLRLQWARNIVKGSQALERAFSKVK